MKVIENSMQESIAVCKVIDTNVANCQDCYRCVRSCPVKAIRITNGQAHIEQEFCIHCGTCVRQCPQQAKYIVSTLDAVKELLASGRPVAASVAPSFAAAVEPGLVYKIPTALRMLGFSKVSETAEGAKLVSDRSLECLPKGSICTTCPAVVSYVEKYHHEALNRMIPVVSPMVAHGRMIKEAFGEEFAVVFIGPCAAKKAEALRPENRDAIDAVITFRELFDWLEEAKLDIADLPDGSFDFTGLADGTLKNARLFPVDGGMLKTCGKASDGTSSEVMSLSGAKQVTSFFDVDPEKVEFKLVEPLFCPGGCIDGPGFTGLGNIYYRKNAVISYAESAGEYDGKRFGNQENVDTEPWFIPLETRADEPVSDEAIQQVFQKTGKTDPRNQLNCGACGYASCRENAIAVVRNMAEPEMCIPYMRRLAQQRADRIIETTPTAVVIVDKDLKLIHMNPAFHKMFMCSNSILGRHISYIFDARDFETLASSDTDEMEAVRTYYGTRYHLTLYAMRSEEQYVGMFTDISHIKLDESQMHLIERQLLVNARELLEHQISFSQEMAHQLGRNTAKTEELVKRMLDLYEDRDL
ncbi:MAG: [Fe-Fe] hydrogenase large subunit C-terminal domain-containing protein [Clostridiales bacterium]|nr:[Fe-Fe] hydrogenase large subunit C-terminal domain-containing protein [Clostridiales bacterium]